MPSYKQRDGAIPDASGRYGPNSAMLSKGIWKDFERRTVRRKVFRIPQSAALRLEFLHL
jgi:hypothetical protein